ncbi:MAG: methyl-accepting chemotaxis protein, partial [Candidatus Caldatribacteriaceae bacterium]
MNKESRKRESRFWGLRGRLLFFFLLTSLVPLVVVVWFGLRNFETALLAGEIRNAREITRTVGMNLGNTLSRNIEYLLLLGKNYDIISPEVPPEEKSKVLTQFVSDHPLLASASLTDKEGTQIADSGGKGLGEKKSDLEWFKVPAQTGKPFLSDIRLSQDLGIYVLNISAPVYDDKGEFLGVITSRMDLRKLGEEITGGVQFAKTGYAYVYCAKHKDTIYHPDSKFIGKTLEEMGVGFLNEPFQKDQGEVRYTFQKVDKIAVFTKVEPYRLFSGDNWKDWRLVGTFPYAEIVEPVTRQTRFTLAVIVIAGVLVALFAFFISGSLALPIRRITDCLEHLSQGKLNVALDQACTKEKGEIGRMAHSLKTMIESWRNLVEKILGQATTLAASSEELSASVGETSRATQEIAKTIAQVADGANRQGEELNHLSETVHSVSQEAQNIEKLTQQNINLLHTTLRERLERNARSLADITREIENAVKEGEGAGAEAGKGQEALAVLLQNIASIAQVAKEVGESVAQLETRSQEIGKIVDVITGIAEQTNLLALNAAIEA